MKEDSSTTIPLKLSLLTCLISVFLGLFYQVFQFGLDGESNNGVVKAIATAWLIILLPEVPRLFTKQFFLLKGNSFLSSYCLTSMCILFLPILGLYLCGYKPYVPTIIIVTAIFLLSITVIRNRHRILRMSSIFHFFMVLIFSILIGVSFWGGEYAHPLFFEKIVLGEAHLDTLFHSSISNMIGTYLTPSTGLDGIPYIPYHWASHGLFAGITALNSIDGITFYNLFFPVIFIPVFLKTVILLGIDLRNKENQGSSFKKEFYLVVLIIVGFLSPLLGRFPFGSESFIISFIFLFCLLGIINQIVYTSHKAKKKRFTNLLIICYCILLLFFISFSKISVGFCLIGVGIYLFLRFQLWKNVTAVSSMVFAIFAFIASSLMVYNKAYIDGVESSPIVRIISSVRDAFHRIDDVGFILFYLFPIIILIWVVRKHRINSINRLTDLIKEKQIIEAEIIVALCVVAFIPGFLVGFNSFYFNSIQIIIGLLLLVYYVHQIFPIRRFVFNDHRSIDMITTGFIALCILTYISRMNTLESFIRDNARIRYELVEGGNQQIPTFNLAELGSGKISDLIHITRTDKLRNNETWAIMNELSEISMLDLALKKKSSLFIPGSNNNYYYSQSFRPAGSSFVGTALTGISMINGQPKEKHLYYGFDLYGPRQEEMNIEEAKIRAKDKGFENLIVLLGGNGNYTHEIIKLN